MPSYGAAYYDLKKELSRLYDEQEATAIAHELLEELSGLSKMDRLMRKDEELNEQLIALYEQAKAELLRGKPLQYVTGKAWFLGREYRVNEHVLIPRPETEELVEWIVNDKKDNTSISILDIGTGSGCIPVSLKLSLPGAELSSCDISNEAIEIAKENAETHSADISFIHSDFLNRKMWVNFKRYDVIVSNPPYIPRAEYENMHQNVRDFEPELALFVPDEEPLVFYRAISEFGKAHLKAVGVIYCELHKDHAEATRELFDQMGYRTDLRADMHGNARMLKCYQG